MTVMKAATARTPTGEREVNGTNPSRFEENIRKLQGNANSSSFVNTAKIANNKALMEIDTYHVRYG